MQVTATITSPLRAQRLLRWAALWLVWLAFFIYEALDLEPLHPPPWIRRWLKFAVRAVGLILIVSAAARMTPPSRTHHRHGSLKRRGRARALIGGVLRRALRAKDVQSTLAALYAAIANPERHIARLMRRLRQGLTRLRTIAPARADTFRVAQTILAPVCADSS
jgi:hypothetical protein